MNVLVTGSTGYLGAWVTQELSLAGHKVGTSPHGGRRHYAKRHDRVWTVTHPAQLRDLISWSDAVVHLAWYSVPGKSDVHEWCVSETERLVRMVHDRKYAKAHQKGRFVFASTLSVYGDTNGVDVDESTIANPNCDYTKGKAIAELGVRWAVPSMHCTLRFGSMMGLGASGGRTRTDLCVNAFATAGYTGNPIRVWDGDAWKPVIHVRDAARLVVEAVNGRLTGTYDCASRCVQAWEIAEVVHDMTGGKVEIVKSERQGNRSCIAHCKKLRSALPGFRFKSLPDTVAEFKGWNSKPGDRTEVW